MKRLNKIKSSLALLVMLIFSSQGIAQVSETAVQIEQTVYEELGISSTTLFMVMLLFTIFLILILIGVLNTTKNVFGFSQSKKTTKTIALLMGIGFSSSITAQEAVPAANDAFINFPDSAFWAFMILDIILIMLILYFVGLMKGVLSQYAPAKTKSVFSRWNKALTNAVEIEDEASILLDHDYDGIKELDNDLPPWWKYGFYVTIVWGVVYFSVYHIFGAAPLQGEEYLAELAESEKEVASFKATNPNAVTEETVQLRTESEILAKGKKIYEMNCAACHLVDGGGSIGPNLTDKYWLYDGDIKGVFHTISEGANNGMASWKGMLSGEKIEAVASYILSLEEVKGGKEPQGENIFE